MRCHTDFAKRKNINISFRRRYAFVLVLLYVSAVFIYADSFRSFAETITESDKIYEENLKGEEVGEPEMFLFHPAENREFNLESSFLSVSFSLNDKGTAIMGIENVPSEFEWVDGISVADLTDVYYDSKGVKKEFSWKYSGCYEYEKIKKLVFEFKSADGKFTCRQNWQICKNDSDGAIVVMSYETEATENIRLPERFSSIALQIKSDIGYSMQYLDGTINEEIVDSDNVIGFKSGSGNGFEMSVPLFYFNTPDNHGIAMGGGSFSHEKTAVLNAKANSDILVCNMDAAYNTIEEENRTVYRYPSFFVAIYGGNAGVGKSFIKNWNVSDTAYKDDTLPLTYDNVVGKNELDSIEEIRNSFFNMMFCFSVSDAKENVCETVKDELVKCDDTNSALYKYILRSAIFCDFDYTTVGLADGSDVKKSAAEHDELYRNTLASTMLNGRHYPIFPGYSENGWDGIEFYDTVNKKGVIFTFRHSADNEMENIIAVQGVSADIEYKVTSLDGSVNIDKIQGSELLSGGLIVSMKDDGLSDIIFIEEAEIDLADVKILLFGNELSSLEIIAIAAVFILLLGIVIAAIIVNAQDEYKEKKF